MSEYPIPEDLKEKYEILLAARRMQDDPNPNREFLIALIERISRLSSENRQLRERWKGDVDNLHNLQKGYGDLFAESRQLRDALEELMLIIESAPKLEGGNEGDKLVALHELTIMRARAALARKESPNDSLVV